MKAYYNEFDPNAAAWLRELIKMKLITDGEVDERSIAEVVGSGVRGFDRVHFFAGIGGWEYALQLAGFTGRVWTGSCPCQPFSSAGNQKGKADDRHLWPHMFRLIQECRPEIVLGEQVDGAIKHGWLDDLCDDPERENYTVRAQVLAAACVGAPHIRKRLYWMAYTTGEQAIPANERGLYTELGSGSDESRLPNSSSQGLQRHRGSKQEPVQTGWAGEERYVGESGSGMGNTEHNGHNATEVGRSTNESETESRVLQSKGSSAVSGMGDTCSTASERNSRGVSGEETEIRCENRSVNGDSSKRSSDASEVNGVGDTEHNGQFTNTITASDVRPSEEWRQDRADVSIQSERASRPSDAASVSGRKDGCGEWYNPDWIYCRDNKYRPIKPGIKPTLPSFKSQSFEMVNGLPGGMVYSSDPSEPIDANETQEARTMRLKGYGNAIVPQLAAEFIRSNL